MCKSELWLNRFNVRIANENVQYHMIGYTKSSARRFPTFHAIGIDGVVYFDGLVSVVLH